MSMRLYLGREKFIRMIQAKLYSADSSDLMKVANILIGLTAVSDEEVYSLNLDDSVDSIHSLLEHSRLVS